MTLNTGIQLRKKLRHLSSPILPDAIRLKEEIIAKIISSHLLTIQNSESSYTGQNQILENLCSEMS